MRAPLCRLVNLVSSIRNPQIIDMPAIKVDIVDFSVFWQNQFLLSTQRCSQLNVNSKIRFFYKKSNHRCVRHVIFGYYSNLYLRIRLTQFTELTLRAVCRIQHSTLLQRIDFSSFLKFRRSVSIEYLAQHCKLNFI